MPATAGFDEDGDGGDEEGEEGEEDVLGCGGGGFEGGLQLRGARVGGGVHVVGSGGDVVLVLW